MGKHGVAILWLLTAILLSLLVAWPNRIVFSYGDLHFVSVRLKYGWSLMAIFGFFALWYYGFPRLTGYSYNPRIAILHYALSILALLLAFAPLLLMQFGFALPPVDEDFKEIGTLWRRFSFAGLLAGCFSLAVFVIGVVDAFRKKRPLSG